MGILMGMLASPFSGKRRAYPAKPAALEHLFSLREANATRLSAFVRARTKVHKPEAVPA
jgi:hypothetical protein